MIGRSRKLLLTCSMLGAIAGTVAAQSPPSGLHQEADGHWTAWNPPQVPEGSQVYRVQGGDSLWSIAGFLLGDSYLWPQLWEANQYILDAHWIYPGDPILITATATSQAMAPGAGVVGDPMDDAQGNLADLTEQAGDPGADGSDPFSDLLGGDSSGPGDGWDPSFADEIKPSAPLPLGFETDIYCSGYIGELEEEFPYAIAGSEYEFLTPSLDSLKNQTMTGLWGKGDTEKYGLENGDIVYIDSGRADGLSAGELLTAIEPKNKVRHPLTDKVMGRIYSYMGRIRVLSVQEETAIGEIVRTCTPIPVGSRLRLFEPEPVPLRRSTPIRPVNFPADNDQLEDAPVILSSVDNIMSLGAGYLVFVDKGEAQDVLPGDIFTIYRKGRRGYPPIILGELGILSVTENTSLARILRSRRIVYAGDVLVIK